MWTWSYEAHEFTHDHDDDGDQVMALFSLSPPKEKNKKKETHFTRVFFTAHERDVPFWRFQRVGHFRIRRPLSCARNSI